MATTIGRLVEQIQRLYASGEIKENRKFEPEEIRLLVGQTLNQVLRKESLELSVPESEYLPTNAALMVMDIDASLFVDYRGFFKAPLPVPPMTLPMGMGVWKVEAVDVDPVPPVELIPIERSYADFYGGGIMPNSYSLEGSSIVLYDQGFIQTGDLIRVYMTGVDVDQLDDWDILNIAPEHEMVAIQMVLQILGVSSERDDDSNDGNDDA